MNVISDYVDTIRKNQIAKQIKRLTKQMEETTDDEYRKKLASRIVELKKQKLI